MLGWLLEVPALFELLELKSAADVLGDDQKQYEPAGKNRLEASRLKDDDPSSFGLSLELRRATGFKMF